MTRPVLILLLAVTAAAFATGVTVVFGVPR